MPFRRFFQGLFFGNYFYGICAIGLSIEASLQQEYPLNEWPYYVLIFALSTWYYTLAYIQDKSDVLHASSNVRTRWYISNRHFVTWSQRILATLSLGLIFFFAWTYWRQLPAISAVQLLQALLVPAAGILYYGINFKRGFSLRRIGWLKPFVIGFTWAGAVTVYPVLFYQVSHGMRDGIDQIGGLLFFKNLMYVAVLCIMFDIKDYAADSNQQLKTFVVEKGLRYTIFRILIPLCLAGLASFWLYASIRHFSFMKIALNTLPFIAILLVAYRLQRRRSILFYLCVIDGLMLFKAICGSLAMHFF